MSEKPVVPDHDGPTSITPLPIWRATPYLPRPLSTLVGRDEAIAATSALVRDRDVRLITLTGPGGVGKTRLALAVAAALTDEFADGAAFVDLTHIHEPPLIIPAIAQALGLSRGDSRPTLTALRSALATRHLLLVLDNFEQVIDAAPHVGDLLSTCPDLTVMVTSRAHLTLSGERIVPVPPLTLPDDASTPGDAEAIRLFVARSCAVRPDFALTAANIDAVVALCTRLEGLPLAIELAAAQSVLLPPDALLARLDERLTVLADGPRDLPDRQRTMLDTIAWSYELLSPGEQEVLRCLSVFVGGATLEAAEAVCAVPAGTGNDVVATIESLARQSLVQVSTTAAGAQPPRLSMLAMVREFAAGELAERGEETAIRQRHAAWFRARAAQSESAFWGDAPVDHLETTYAERGNLRGALAWAIDHDETDLALHLASAIFDPYLLHYAHYLVRTDPQDHLVWARRALAMPGGAVAPRVSALTKAAWLAQTEGDLGEGQTLAEEALRIARNGGDELGEATAAYVLGRAAFRQGDLDAARDHLTAALARFEALGVPGRAAWAQCVLAAVDTRAAADAGDAAVDLTAAAGWCDAAIAAFQAAGHRPGILRAMHGRATVAYYQRDFARALALIHEVLTQAWEAGLTVRHYLENIAHIAARRGQSGLAARLYGAAEEERQRYGSEILPVREAELALGMAPAREALGAEAFAAGMADGRALPPEQAVATALRFAAAGDAPSEITLSPREREVLPLLARGMTAREIGAELYLSRRTIEHHTARIAAKLGVRTRVEIVATAREAGLLDADNGSDRTYDDSHQD